MNPFTRFKTSIAMAIAAEETVARVIAETDVEAEAVRTELAKRCALSSRPLVAVLAELEFDVAEGRWPEPAAAPAGSY
jgi:hypothetical protein